MSRKGPEAFRTIAEAAEEVGVPAHVLRFWESRFPFIQPLKRSGGRRFYRPADIAMLCELRRILHDEGVSIKGAQALPRRRWRAAAASTATVPREPSAGGGSLVLIRSALERAIRARAALNVLIGSSTG